MTAELQTACQASPPSRAVVYLWVKHIPRENSTVDARGKGKKPEGKKKENKKRRTKKKKRTKTERGLVKATIDKDARVTIQEIANTFDITSRSVSEILIHYLGYRKVCDRWPSKF